MATKNTIFTHNVEVVDTNYKAGKGNGIDKSNLSFKKLAPVTDLGSGTATLADGDYGSVTVSGTGTVITIDASAVTNAMQANMPTNTIKGNDAGGAAAPQDLTVAEVKTLLAYTATNITNTPAGNIAATNVQTALNELDGEKQQAIRFEDEGVPIGSGAGYVDTINFVGSGVTVTDSTGGNIIVTVAGSTADTIGTHNGATFRYSVLTGTPTVTYVTSTPTAPVLTVAGGTIKLKELWVPYSQGGSTDPIFLINGTVSADRAYSTPLVTKVIENSTTPAIAGTYNQQDTDNTPQVRFGDYAATSMQVQIAAVTGSWNFGFLFSMNQ